MRCHGRARRPPACGRFRRRGGVRVGCNHSCLLPGKGRDGVSLFRAPLRVRACGAAGGRIAAARFARVIARARRRAHLARPFPPGCFSRPQPSLSAEKPKGGPGSRLSLLSFYHTSPQVKPVREQKMKMPTETTSKQTAGAPMLFPARPSSSCPGRGTTGGALRHDEAASGGRCSLTCIARSETMR